MSIDNISRIYEKNVECSYLFDIQVRNDEEATSSYIIRCNKRHNDPSLTKITDYSEIISELKKIKARAVDSKSKDYSRFFSYLETYIKKYQYDKLMDEENDDNITDDDIKSITSEYKHTLKNCRNK